MPGQRAHRPVLVGAVGQAVVDLVAVDEQVVADGDVRQRVGDVVRQDGPGRVARVAQEQRLGPGRDRRLDGGRVQREVVLEAGRDVTHDAAGEDDGRDVRHVRRFVEDDLVTRVARRAQRQVDRLGRPDRDQQLGGRVVVDAVSRLEVARQGPPQLERPEVAGVVGAALAQALHARLDDDPRRVEVGLADAQADDVVHRRRDVEEPPDPRGRHALDALREHAIGERGARARVGRHQAGAAAPRAAAIRSAGVGTPGSAAAASSAGSSERHDASAVIAS